MMRRYSTAFAVLLIAAPAALASSPDAWTEYETEVREACFKASGMTENLEAESNVIAFSDEVGRDAMIIEGDNPQQSVKDADFLCLFDKVSRTAVTSEIMDD
jgi:hypothetical protein